MKRRTKLSLSRETLRHLASPAELHAAAGGLTALTHCVTCPLTHCAASVCVGTCIKCTSVQVVCTA